MATSPKIDLYRQHRQDYVTPKKPVLVTIAPAVYLTITGRGEPGGERFQGCIGALYAAAFTIKMTSKAAGRDYAVCKLEALWWGSGGSEDLCQEPPSTWNWKLLIRTPDFIAAPDLARAVAALRAKGKGSDVAQVKRERITEGRCVQMLHVGPYADEERTIKQMHAHAEANGFAFHGLHHEIYLSDPRRVEPARLRTILRHPVR